MKQRLMAALAVIVGFAIGAWGRTVSIVEQSATTVTLDFGVTDGRADHLCLAYGETDKGDEKHAWDGFLDLGPLGAEETRRVYEVPAKLRDGRFLRFFLLQKDNLPIAQEVKGVFSTSQQWVDTDYYPCGRTVVDFRFGDVSYENATAFFGQNWTGSRYLFNQQSNNFYFHSGGQSFGVYPAAGVDYRLQILEDSYLILTYSGTEKIVGSISRGVLNGAKMAIFGCNDGTHPSSFRFDRMKIAQFGVLQRDYIPAVSAEGVAGLYDQLHNTFITSKTSVPLNAGDAYTDGRFGRVLGESVSFKFRRAVTVAARTADKVTLRFDNTDTANLDLYLAYGTTDGGDAKLAWTNFDRVLTVTPDMKTCEYELPEALKADGLYYRFFLLKTTGLPYGSELTSLTSTGGQTIRTGIQPTANTTVDFSFGNDTYVSGTCLLGQGWNGYSYLLNQQGSTMFYFHGRDGSTLASVTAGRDYNFRTTADGNVVFRDGTTATKVIAEPHLGNPLSELSVFGCDSVTRGSKFRFDSLKIAENGFPVRDFIAVNVGGKGALFDRITGTVYSNRTSTDFAKGGNADRFGWVLNATQTLRTGAVFDAAANPYVLPADADWTEILPTIPSGLVVDLNGHTLRATASETLPFEITGKGTFELTVPENATATSTFTITGGAVNLVKRGAGTYVVATDHKGLASFTIEEGLVEMGGVLLLEDQVPVTVKSGAAFDMKGFGGNCAVFTIAGEGPDGKGALRNTGASLDIGYAQMSGLNLSDDALVTSTGHFGLLDRNSSTYLPTTFELNGHTLTINYPKGMGFWFTRTTGSTDGTVKVISGIPYFYHTSYPVYLPNVDFVLDGADSIFRIPGSGRSSKITLRDVTVQNGASYENGSNVSYVRNFTVYDGGLVPKSGVSWIYMSGTLTVSNETTDVTFYEPITNNGTYPNLIKQGKAKLTLAPNHTDQRIDKGADIQGGTVVMDSTASTLNYHVAISSVASPVTLHAGTTWDISKCEQPVKLSTLLAEDGATILATASNVLQFPNATTFAKAQPFTGAMKVAFLNTVTFNLADLFAGDDAPKPGDTVTLLEAGSITCNNRISVTGCPYGTELVKTATSLAVKLTNEPASSGTPQIKIFTLGGTLAYCTAVNGASCSFRGELAQALTTEGWNVKMTGWRHALYGATGLADWPTAWTGFAAGTDLALKTSATRAGILEGLETYCSAAEEPDFTIFVCGDTDIADGVNENTVYANWTEAVSRIRSALPMTTVLACTIPNASNSLNNRLTSWCAEQDEVEAVDLSSVISTQTPTAAEYLAAAQLLKEKLLTLATSAGKKTPTEWTRPEVKLGAENNVPAAYREGYQLVRVMEPGATVHYAQNLEAIPYAYAPAFQRTNISKVAYYIELVRKDTGALQALWVDMDAMGSNWADVAFPVTLAQQKQQTVTSLHVWCNTRAVTQVPADDDSVSGYIEFNCLNYGGDEKTSVIAEPWTGKFGFDDTFVTSGTSGHGCFQLMRQFGSGTPAGEILFAFNRWGGTSDVYYAIGLGTLADYGNLGYNSSPTLDRTFMYGNGANDVDNIASAAFSLRRISFYLKYSAAGTVDRTATVTGTWTGSTDAAFETAANWVGTDGTTALTTIDNQILRVPDTADIAYTYKGYDPLNHAGTTLLVDGRATFADVGGLYLNTLDLGPSGSIAYDPTKFTFRLRGVPNFSSGAKISLLNASGKTAGRYLLMTWDGGNLATDEATLTALFDTASAAGANVKIWAENFDLGGGRLWLDLNASATYPRVNVLCVGDSITQGSDSTYGNWRTGLMKKLCAAGYDPVTKGFWTIQSHDICGATMPEDWTRHAGIGGQRIETTTGGAGTLNQIEATLDQAGDVDFVLLKLGTNDINGNGATAETLYPSWEALVKKILAQKPHAKVIAGAVVDIADATKNAQVIAFNARVKAATENGTFPEGRVFFSDLYTPCYRYDADGNFITGSFQSATDLHPDWPGEDKMAETYCASMIAAIGSAEAGWTLGAEETVTDTTSGIENNVAAADREGYRLARVLDVTKHNTENLANLSASPYEDFSASTAAVSDIARVGYYIELKRKNGAGCDYRGLVRWLWVTMDAFGGRTIADVGVPFTTYNQCTASRLRVRTNVPGLADTPAKSYETGWVEFWPSPYGNGAVVAAGAPAGSYGYDWNDTCSGGTSGYGSMQVHRLTPGASTVAEVLFAYNRWTYGAYHEIGCGNFANVGLSSTDWTFSGDSARGMVDTMTSAAYEVARIEIWTLSDADANAGAAQADVTGYTFENGVATVEGELSSLGANATEATVSIEWSTDPDFDAAHTQTQVVGTFTATGKIATTVPGLTVGSNWYFRFTTTNDQSQTSTSEASDAWDLSTAVWRATADTDTWQSTVWKKNGAGDAVAFTDGVPVRFDGAETGSPAVVAVNAAVNAANVAVTADRDYTFGGTGTVTTPTLVKKGAGTLTLEKGVLGSTRDITVEAGTVKLGDTATPGAAGTDGGTITVKKGASFDLNYVDTAAGATRSRALITSGKKFVIAGDGVNGEGALTTSSTNTFWGSPFNEIELTESATIGGHGRIDMRNNTKNAITGPTNATLTIANDAVNGTRGFNTQGPISVGKLAIAEGGTITLEGTGNILTLPLGIDLKGYMSFWAATPTWNTPGVTVAGTEAAIGNDSGTSYLAAPLTVPSETKVTLKGAATMRYTGAVANDGEVAVTSGYHYLDGATVTGAGTYSVTSGNLYFRNTADLSGADLKLTSTGGQIWWGIYGDGGTYPQAKSIDASGVTGGLVFLSGDGAVIPSAFAAATPSTVYTLCESIDQTITMEPGDYTATGNLILSNTGKPGHLKLDKGVNVTVNAAFLGNDGGGAQPAILEVGEGATFTTKSQLWVAHWSDVNKGQHVYVNGGTVNAGGEGIRVGIDGYRADIDINAGTVNATELICRRAFKDPATFTERLALNGGTLNVGASGIVGWTRYEPFLELNNGTFNASANFAVEQMRAVSFGDQTGGTVDFNVGDKTVNWQTGLRGKADVNLKGSGTFTSGQNTSRTKMKMQGVPTGHWTISNTGVNNLYGAAGFAGGLTLGENVTANLNIADDTLVECAFLQGGPFATAKTASGLPFAANDLSMLHASGDANDYTYSSIVWQGSFYCDTPGTWTFAGTYDDNASMAVDGKEIFSSTGWTNIGQGKVALTLGWHDFRIVQYQGGGGWGAAAATGWSGKMGIGFAKSSVDGTDVANFTKFDGTNLKLRPSSGAQGPNGLANWSSVANNDSSTWNTRTDLASNGFFQLSKLHTYNYVASPTLSASTHQFSGYVYVTAAQAGVWAVSLYYDDNISFQLDGVDSGSLGAVTEGWHTFRIRVRDGGGGWGPWSNAGYYCRVSVNGTQYVFDETEFQIAAYKPLLQGVEHAGLDGTTELKAGSTLQNDATEGACPIWGTLKGSGTLAGTFAFAGDENCYEVSGTGVRRTVEESIDFQLGNADGLAGLKKIKAVFRKTPGCPTYDVGGAYGAQPDAIAVEVLDVSGKDYSENFSAAVVNDRLVLKNAHPNGLALYFR